MTPDMGSDDNGIEFLKGDTRRQLLGKPATSKPQAVKVGAKTSSSRGVGGHLEV